MTASLRQGLAQIADIWGIVERMVAGLLISTMVLLYAFNVIVRLFMPTQASSFAWIDEAARYLMIWAVFMGVGITLDVGRHIAVDLFTGKFSRRALDLLYKVIDITGIVFCVGASYFSLKLLLFVAGTGQVSPTLGIPAAVLYGAPFIGFASLALRFLLRLTNIRDARRSPVKADWLGSDHA